LDGFGSIFSSRVLTKQPHLASHPASSI
jgi:hypothetical protein